MTSQLRLSLRAVAREMDVPGEDWTVYLNRRTGEMLSVNDEEIYLVENDEESEECDDGTSEWPAEHLAKVREKLLRAIEGRGAFRRFKDLAHASGRIEAWYAFRDGAIEELAAEWLEANGIGYYRGEAP